MEAIRRYSGSPCLSKENSPLTNIDVNCLEIFYTFPIYVWANLDLQLKYVCWLNMEGDCIQKDRRAENWEYQKKDVPVSMKSLCCLWFSSAICWPSSCKVSVNSTCLNLVILTRFRRALLGKKDFDSATGHRRQVFIAGNRKHRKSNVYKIQIEDL